MRRAIYPGSFDPITNGHLDIIGRSCKLFDEVIVALLINVDKNPLFNFDERLALMREVVAEWPNAKVASFKGLLVHYAAEQQAGCIIRGIRAVADYEYELQMALMNRRLAPQIETIFMMASEPYSYLSSRLAKEVFMLGGSIAGLVPELVTEKMREKLL